MTEQSAELLAAAENVAAARALVERVGSETKSLERAITAEGDDTYTMCFSVFGVLDYAGDIVQPGAFRKSISERKSRLPVLWDHDMRAAAIGVVRTLDEHPKSDLPEWVVERWPEATGAAIARVSFFDTPRGQEIAKGIDGGAPYQASYAFDVLGKDSRKLPDGRKARILTDVRLHELTVCNFGANPATYLSKALALISEWDVKAGRRHSAQDDELIDAIGELLIALGARNIQRTAHDAAAPQAAPARTTEASTLISSVRKLLEATP